MADCPTESPTLDVQRLEASGLLAPDVLPELFVPFQVVRVGGATVAWLNRRWFAEQGIEIWNESVRAQAEAWLLRNFAFVVPCAAHDGPRHTFMADRYGSTEGLSPHGGSGRVATRGCFQVKGVGPTPLVGKGVRDGHSHGCLSLAEALREAIYAEVAAAEFPYGAVPIIAIIDLGSNYSSPDRREKYDQDVRRGLLVRPFVFRPSHIERAPLYGSGNDTRLEQLADARRAKRAYRWWKEQIATGDMRFAVPPGELFHRLGRQIGFGQAHRLFNGGYFSSNLSARGELLDFGNMHWLRRWHRARVLPHAPGFGDEIRILRKVAHSTSFFFQHWSDGQDHVDDQDLVDKAQSAMKYERKRQMAHFFDEKLLDGTILARVEDIYESENKVCRTFEFGVPVGRTQQDSSLADIISGQFAAMKAHLGAESAYLHAVQLRRFCGERVALDRFELITATREIVGEACDCTLENSNAIDTFVASKVSQGRRLWPRMRPGLIPLRHLTRGGSSLVDCVELGTGQRLLWLEGEINCEGAKFFENSVSILDLSKAGSTISSPQWILEIKRTSHAQLPAQVPIGGTVIRLPHLECTYVV